MVIFYYKETKQIKYTEENVMIPNLPMGTLEEKKEILSSQGLDFVAIPYELGNNIYNYNLCFDETDRFIGIQPK